VEQIEEKRRNSEYKKYEGSRMHEQLSCRLDGKVVD